MNITPITITGFTLQFTEAEVRALLADLSKDSPFCGPLKAALNGAFDDGAQPVTGPKGRDAQGRRKGKALRNYPKERAKKITAAKNSTKSPCEICGRTIATKFMTRHMSAKHGQATAAGA